MWGGGVVMCGCSQCVCYLWWLGRVIHCKFHYTPYHCLFPFCIFPLHICIFPLHISILHIPLQLTVHAQYVIAITRTNLEMVVNCACAVRDS